MLLTEAFWLQCIWECSQYTRLEEMMGCRGSKLVPQASCGWATLFLLQTVFQIFRDFLVLIICNVCAFSDCMLKRIRCVTRAK